MLEEMDAEVIKSARWYLLNSYINFVLYYDNFGDEKIKSPVLNFLTNRIIGLTHKHDVDQCYRYSESDVQYVRDLSVNDILYVLDSVVYDLDPSGPFPATLHSPDFQRIHKTRLKKWQRR